MIDFIQDKFTEITSKCLDRKAKEQGALKKDMQLVFKLKENEVEYLICHNYKTISVVSFMDVLGVKIDFKGYSIFVPKFIRGALNRFSEELDIQKSDVRVILSFDSNNNMMLMLYNSNKYVKQVEFESLFNGQDILEEN